MKRSIVLVAAAAAALTVASASATPAIAGPASLPAIQAIDNGKSIRFGAVEFDPLRRPPGADPAYRSRSDGKGLRFVQFNQRIQGGLAWRVALGWRSSLAVLPTRHLPGLGGRIRDVRSAIVVAGALVR